MASVAAQQAVAAVAAAQAKDTAIAVRLVFLRAAYDKLLAERDGRKNKALSEAVHNVAGRIKVGPSACRDVLFAHAFLPLQLAVTSHVPRLVLVALECLEKLLSYGNLHGGDVYDPETTLLQAAFTPTNLLTPSAEGDDGGDHDADEDGNGTTTVPLSGKPASGAKGPRTVIDQMVDLICSAYSTEDLSSDKPNPSLIAIEQMVVKALLPAVTSVSANLHGQFLLLAVRTVYNIVLNTRDRVSQTTARAAVTQMVDTIFQRMQGFGDALPADIDDLIHPANTSLDSYPASRTITPDSTVHIVTSDAPGAAAPVASDGVPPAEGASPEATDGAVPPTTADSAPTPETESVPAATADGGEVPSDAVSPAEDAPADAAVAAAAPQDDAEGLAEDEDEDDEEAMAEVHTEALAGALDEEDVLSRVGVDAVALPEVHIDAATPAGPTAAAAAATAAKLTGRSQSSGRAPSDFAVSIDVGSHSGEPLFRTSSGQLLQAESPLANSASSSTPPLAPMASPQASPMQPSLSARLGQETGGVRPRVHAVYRDLALSALEQSELRTVRAFGLLLQRDAYLIFRAFCRLTMKPTPMLGDSDGRPTAALRSKILSLQLLLHLLQHSGRVFQTSDMFVSAIKKYLVLALCTNALYAYTQVTDLTLRIFLLLLTVLPANLKYELDVCFRELFFKVLQSRSATFEQKLLLVETLTRIASKPQVVMDIYLNFDCDPDLLDSNVFERIVIEVSKLGQARIAVPERDREGPSTVAMLPDYKLKVKALECLTVLLRSLLIWTKEGPAARRAEAMAKADAGHDGDDASTSTSTSATGTKPAAADGSAAPVPSPAESVPATPAPGPSATPAGVPLVTSSSSLSMGVPPAGSKQGGTRSTSRAAVATDMADDPAQFQHIKNVKQWILEGVDMFNYKPKKGIKFLLGKGCIKSNTPHDIAAFIHHTPGLHKTMVGEYLGEGDDEIIPIMHAYVDLMDFTGLNFMSALRKFLGGFRLPGEAQKIDRFMLKFAERFLVNNPGVFANADTAYVLAYSVIMLNVDQHNPQVKKRMTKQEFIKNNRGINNNSDLPEQVLTDIFDDISINELRLKDDDNKPVDMTAMSQGKTKKTAFLQQSQEILKRTQALFKERQKMTNTKVVFYKASRVEHVKPMFELVWMNFLVTFSGPMQDSEDPALLSLCLEGFLYAFQISSMFYLDLQKNAFFSTLVKYTHLTAPDAKSSTIRPKNVAAIRTLLEAALTSGNTMNHLWHDTFVCISQMEKLQLLNDDLVDLANAGADAGRSTSGPAASSRASAEVSRSVARLIDMGAAQNLVVMVDQIFSSSRHLNGDAIVEFVQHLCETSISDIEGSASLPVPRMYSLQRLVEISYYNMARIRLEWSRIWAILGEHFNQVGTHPNLQVASFAVDALRQLSMRFLEKGELAHFQFQKDFLSPFDYIYANNQDVGIRDMVLRCLMQMLQARASSIKSGWKPLVGVFRLAAQEPHANLISMAFEGIRMMFDNHFASLVMQGTFSTFVAALVAFTQNRRFEKTGLHAMNILTDVIPFMATMSTAQKTIALFNSSYVTQAAVAQAAQRDASGVLPVASADLPMLDSPALNVIASPSAHSLLGAIPSPGFQNLSGTVGRTSDIDLQFWFPLLFGLYEITMSCELEVRTRACQLLFGTLKEFGTLFSPTFWDVTFRGVLFPIFDDLKWSSQRWLQSDLSLNLDDEAAAAAVESAPVSRPQSPLADGTSSQAPSSLVQAGAGQESLVDPTEWINTTCVLALRSVVDLFSHYFERLVDLLDAMLGLLTTCTLQDNETLVRLGTSAITSLITLNLSHLTAAQLDNLCEAIGKLFDGTLPHQLLEYRYQETPQATTPGGAGTSGTVNDNAVAMSASSSVAALEAFLVVPPVVLAVLSDPKDLVSPTALAAGGLDSATETSSLRESRLSISLAVATSMQGGRTSSERVLRQRFQTIVAKCTLQLLLIQTVNELVIQGDSQAHYLALGPTRLLAIAANLERSYKFASSFNSNTGLRRALAAAGFITETASLLTQETYASASFLVLMRRMLSDSSAQFDAVRSSVQANLYAHMLAVLSNYEACLRQRRNRDVKAWTGIVSLVLLTLDELSITELQACLPAFYTTVVRLVDHALPTDVRKLVVQLLMKIGRANGYVSDHPAL